MNTTNVKKLIAAGAVAAVLSGALIAQPRMQNSDSNINLAADSQSGQMMQDVFRGDARQNEGLLAKAPRGKDAQNGQLMDKLPRGNRTNRGGATGTNRSDQRHGGLGCPGGR